MAALSGITLGKPFDVFPFLELIAIFAVVALVSRFPFLGAP